jgi:hypothetical protein
MCNEDPLMKIANFDLTCCMNWFNGKTTFYFDSDSEFAGNVSETFYNTLFKPNKKYTGCERKYKKEDRIKKYTDRGFNIVEKSLNIGFIYRELSRGMEIKLMLE